MSGGPARTLLLTIPPFNLPFHTSHADPAARASGVKSYACIIYTYSVSVSMDCLEDQDPAQASILLLGLPQHQFGYGVDCVFVVEKDRMHGLGDGHFDAVPSRECDDAFCGRHAFDNRLGRL